MHDYNEPDKFLLLYLVDNDFIPILSQAINSDDDSSSESSVEIGEIALTHPNQEKKDSSDNLKDHIHKSMSELVGDEEEYEKPIYPQMPLEQQISNNIIDGFYDDSVWLEHPQIENDKLNSESHPDNVYENSNLNNKDIDYIEKPIKLNQTGKRKNHDYMREGYQKIPARSDEQSFLPHKRQQPLIVVGGNSLIEEENKSKSNLNLSTSSRSYKPGISKAKSICSDDSTSLFKPSFSSYYPGQMPTNLSHKSSQLMYTSSGMPIHPMNAMMPTLQPMISPIQGVIPGQYSYPVNMISPVQGFGSHSIPSYGPVSPTLVSKQVIQHSQSAKPTGTPLQSQPVTRASAPTTMTNTTSSSTKLTSGSASPPPSTDIKITTGYLKFFNQQHQYGFIVTEKDQLDVFFHYDDVKHTQLSKGNFSNSTIIIFCF